MQFRRTATEDRERRGGRARPSWGTTDAEHSTAVCNVTGSLEVDVGSMMAASRPVVTRATPARTRNRSAGTRRPRRAPAPSWATVRPTAPDAVKKPTDWPRSSTPPRLLTILSITGTNAATNTAYSVRKPIAVQAPSTNASGIIARVPTPLVATRTSRRCPVWSAIVPRWARKPSSRRSTRPSPCSRRTAIRAGLQLPPSPSP